jgi:hypothetical protein
MLLGREAMSYEAKLVPGEADILGHRTRKEDK